MHKYERLHVREFGSIQEPDHGPPRESGKFFSSLADSSFPFHPAPIYLDRKNPLSYSNQSAENSEQSTQRLIEKGWHDVQQIWMSLFEHLERKVSCNMLIANEVVRQHQRRKEKIPFFEPVPLNVILKAVLGELGVQQELVPRSSSIGNIPIQVSFDASITNKKAPHFIDPDYPRRNNSLPENAAQLNSITIRSDVHSFNRHAGADSIAAKTELTFYTAPYFILKYQFNMLRDIQNPSILLPTSVIDGMMVEAVKVSVSVEPPVIPRSSGRTYL